MTTPGGQFPTLTQQGVTEWWVINQISRSGGPRGPQTTNYVVVSSPTEPINTVQGPFTTKAEAQAWASNATLAGSSPLGLAQTTVSSLGNLTGLNAIGDLAHRLTESQTWIRVGEFLAGTLLLYVGAKAFFPTAVNNVTTTVKGTVKAAKAGLI